MWDTRSYKSDLNEDKGLNGLSFKRKYINILSMDVLGKYLIKNTRRYDNIAKDYKITYNIDCRVSIFIEIL